MTPPTQHSRRAGDRPARAVAAARQRQVSPLHLFVGALVAGALALGALALTWAVRREPELDAAALVIVLLLCLLADRPLLDIRFGHQQESFTWAEMSVLVGLVLVPVPVLVVIGGCSVLVYHLARRLDPIKIAFNAASFALSVALAGAVYLPLAGSEPSSLRTAGALGGAAFAFAALNGCAVAGAVAMASHQPFGEVYRRSLKLRVLITCCNALAGIGMVLLADASRIMLVALPPLLLVMYAAYRTYLSATEERDVWQQLEASSRELNTLEEADVAGAALRRAAQLFRPDRVELVLVASPPRPARRYSVDDAGRTVLLELPDAGGLMPSATTVVELDASGCEDVTRTVLSAPLDSPRGRLGSLRLLFGGPVTLTSRERQVLSTFAHAVSTTLLNAALYDDVRNEAARKAHEASHDHLTGLGNRSLLVERTHTAVLRQQGTTALLLLDLDHFKEINDTLGHAAGDVLLQEVGRRLKEFAGDRHLVARLGGDEFAVLLTGLAAPSSAEPVAETVLGLLSDPVEFEGLRLSVEASLGVACHPQDADTADELFRRADVAMYQAKATRGQWLRYSADRDDSSVHRQALVAELRAALENDQIVVHYQPQVDLESGLLVGAEALCRWEHPTRGLLAPGDFVGVAEQSGLVRPFTLRVLDQAVGQCVLWQDHGRPVSVAVNLSARSLLDRQLPCDVAAVLARHGLPPDRLVLEITETTATSELEVVEDVLAALREMGVEISVDDFGTGYSSLAFLQRTAVHELKVDRTFVSGMLASENDLALVRATVQLARSLGARSVAEGVEDGAQAAALRDMGCDVAQGYWLSRPIAAAGMRSLLGLRVTAEPGVGLVPTPRQPGLRVLRPAAGH